MIQKQIRTNYLDVLYSVEKKMEKWNWDTFCNFEMNHFKNCLKYWFLKFFGVFFLFQQCFHWYFLAFLGSFVQLKMAIELIIWNIMITRKAVKKKKRMKTIVQTTFGIRLKFFLVWELNEISGFISAIAFCLFF